MNRTGLFGVLGLFTYLAREMEQHNIFPNYILLHAVKLFLNKNVVVIIIIICPSPL